MVLGIVVLFIGVVFIPNISGNLEKTSIQFIKAEITNLHFNADYVNAYWKLDEGSGSTAFDSSGHGYDGIIYGANWITGYSGYALDFDGLDDFVDFDDYAINYLGFNSTEDVIFSFYFKTTSAERGVIYSTCRGDAYGYSPGVHIALASNGTIEFQVWMGGCGILMHSEDTFNDGSWHFVEVYYNGHSDGVRKANATGIIYVDDTLQGIFVYEVCSFWSDQFHYAQMGRNSSSSIDYFEGVIDEFKIIKYEGGNKQEPPIIDGPTYGDPGVEYDFTFTTSDPEEDELLEIEIDWGNGDIWDVDGPFESGEEVIVSYSWAEKGTYNIKARSKNIWGYSDWSDPYVVKIGNSPPTPPSIVGQTHGDIGTLYEYGFTSTDPDGHDIAEYIINWGDGTGDETVTGPFASGEEAKASHKWTKAGTFVITAKAVDEKGLEGPAGTLSVTMPRDRIINNMVILRLIGRFLLLQNLLILIR